MSTRVELVGGIRDGEVLTYEAEPGTLLEFALPAGHVPSRVCYQRTSRLSRQGHLVYEVRRPQAA